MKRLAVLGASGHGKVVAETASLCGWQHILFFDDAWPSLQSNGLWPVIGDTRALLEQLHDFDGVIVGIGNNHVRLKKTRDLKALDAPLITLVHPSAYVSSTVALGAGSVIFAGAVIQIDSRVGEACVVNTRASIDHDCLLHDGSHVCPGASLAGAVTVGEASWIGIGASVIQLLNIGHNVTVGAGAVVVSEISNGQTVIGVPARPVIR
ncbi:MULTISPECIES: acetyltransferase [unclassified Halomonas]|uniref:acetyltransferase n=1 Tax=unclassified Halomonas TaxID=2609666 RepID=UPI0021E477EE|nr:MULTISPECIES: acetyltransferase [unclassified Halomonas]UYF99265.1 acetyltransferase [Halomonas sp. GD1P12]WNL39578.1 acetyltransferase [Halomonas sp. PAMB 3232]WNL42935.1 acetyltransferase [Halomonas sp. PAMB 3264]